MARGYRTFRERGMPFATEPREKVHGTWPMCRVVIATRRLSPEREYAVFRALQFAQFTSTLFLEDQKHLLEAISWVPGIDAEAIIAATGDPENEALFEQDRDEARTAAGSPTEFQNKHANTDGRVRYTAPSIKFKNEQGVTLEAGGFQTFEAYDVLIANLDQSLERRAPAEDAARGPAGLPGRPDDRRGRADHDRGQVHPGPQQGRGRPDRRDRRRRRHAPAVRARRAVGARRARGARRLERRREPAGRNESAPPEPHTPTASSSTA